jgi:hypothetical protein
MNQTREKGICAEDPRTDSRACARGRKLRAPALSRRPLTLLTGPCRQRPGSSRPEISALCQHTPTQRGTKTSAILPFLAQQKKGD